MTMSFNRSTSKLVTFLIASSLAGSTSLALEAVLLRHGVTSLGVLVVSNLITGAVGGTLILQFKILQHERRQVMEDRLRKVADVNHHVRNALAIVAYYGTRGGDAASAEMVSEAVKRIEWTLREVLPKGWDVGPRLRHPLIGSRNGAGKFPINNCAVLGKRISCPYAKSSFSGLFTRGADRPFLHQPGVEAPKAIAHADRIYDPRVKP